MKKIIFTSLLGISLFLVAFTPSEFAKKVKLNVELKDCVASDTLYLYQFEGFGFSKVFSSVGKNGSFEFKFPQSTDKIYYLGKDIKQVVPIVLGTESEVEVKGSCNELPTASVNSKLNDEYKTLREKISGLKQSMNKKMQELQAAKSNEGAQRMAIFEMSEIDDEQMALLNEYRDKSPLFNEIVALNTYLSFQNNGTDYYSEIDYFANEFFQFVDFKNTHQNYNPWIYEAFKEYAITLSSINMEKELHQSYIDDALNKLTVNEQSYQLALSGIVAALDEKKHKNYTLYGKRLIKQYEKAFPNLIAPLKKRIIGLGPIEAGDVAPDFTQKTPEGEELKLSDLRGKIVLVDFWASWCGPCRRENPHVKELYEKYSHRGFEILGVSLDRNASSWTRAIEQDGLEWYHVSDLKGWKNEVAKMYSVSSIPHTILLDQEGRIIARKLRAVQLEQVLEQIFGS